jgi:hypothetical protein
MADVYHYNSLHVGDQATAVGGAFTALADDPSAIYYNPAGIVFLGERELSASMNAYHGQQSTIRGLFATDYKSRSGSVIPVFLGGSMRLNRAWVFGYGIYSPNREATERDELVTNDAKNDLLRFRHILRIDEDTSYFSAALAREVDVGAIGIAVAVLQHKRSMHQTVISEFGPFSDQTAKELVYQYHYTNRQQQDLLGIAPTFGYLGKRENTTFGLSATAPVVIREQDHVHEHTFGLLVDSDLKPAGDDPFVKEETEASNLKIIGDWPMTIRGGLATTVGPWTITPDINWHSAKQSHKLRRKFVRNAVTNYGLGIRYRPSQAMGYAAGIFTNFDARPEVGVGTGAGHEHEDFIGLSAGIFHWTKKKTRYSVASTVQYGTGHVQLSGRDQDIAPQAVRTWMYTLGGSISTAE